MNADNIEQRVADLEKEVAALRERLLTLSPVKPWWERIAGTFENDPIYEEAMKLGREYRDAQRPKRKKKKS